MQLIKKNIQAVVSYDPVENVAVVVKAKDNQFITTYKPLPSQIMDLYDNPNLS
jgi:hypothetical protein